MRAWSPGQSITSELQHVVYTQPTHTAPSSYGSFTVLQGTMNILFLVLPSLLCNYQPPPPPGNAVVQVTPPTAPLPVNGIAEWTVTIEQPAGRKKETLPAEILLEDTDGLRGGDAIHQ